MTNTIADSLLFVWLTIVCKKILMEFIPLIFQDLSQVNCYFFSNLLYKVIKLSQVIR